MRSIKYAAAVAALSATTLTAQAATLDDVKARGELNCVVSTGIAGFAAPDDAGKWSGLDVDFCRAVAAAVVGDPEKVKFVPTTGKNRFTVLNSGEGDILFRNTTETMSRDADLKLRLLVYLQQKSWTVPRSVSRQVQRQNLTSLTSSV